MKTFKRDKPYMAFFSSIYRDIQQIIDELLPIYVQKMSKIPNKRDTDLISKNSDKPMTEAVFRIREKNCKESKSPLFQLVQCPNNRCDTDFVVVFVQLQLQPAWNLNVHHVVVECVSHLKSHQQPVTDLMTILR